MNPRSQPPRPTTSTGIMTNTRVPHTSAPSKTALNTGIATTTAGQSGRTINVKAVGRSDFRSAGKTATAGNDLD